MSDRPKLELFVRAENHWITGPSIISWSGDPGWLTLPSEGDHWLCCPDGGDLEVNSCWFNGPATPLDLLTQAAITLEFLADAEKIQHLIKAHGFREPA
jgi:hypothetical protein